MGIKLLQTALPFHPGLRLFPERYLLVNYCLTIYLEGFVVNDSNSSIFMLSVTISLFLRVLRVITCVYYDSES